MKLYASFSEAIREGAKLRPQAIGYYFSLGRSCALGAVLEISYGNTKHRDFVELNRAYPYMVKEEHVCPESKCAGNHTLLGLVLHLNDDHQWTREVIADWLETEEEKLGFVTVVENESAQPAKAYSLTGASHETTPLHC